MNSNLSRIYQSIEFIKENVADEITIEQCSMAAGMSTSYFLMKFKQFTGYAPYEFIRKMRLERSTQAVLGHKRILDAAVDSGYGSNEAFTRAFIKEYGVTPTEYQSGNLLCSIEQLDDMEKLVAFLPAPAHREYLGHLYYKEHKAVYDSLIQKGYFQEKTLDYRIEAKQLTEKYAYDFATLIIHTIGLSTALSDLYNNVIKVKYLPKLLFYTFVREMAENGMLVGTQFEKYSVCSQCDFCTATLGDADFIRDKVIKNWKDKNREITPEEIFCLGYTFGECSAFCPFKDEMKKGH